ncbi:hypothetical protein TSHO111613_15700 [Tsukamurella hominis]
MPDPARRCTARWSGVRARGGAVVGGPGGDCSVRARERRSPRRRIGCATGRLRRRTAARVAGVRGADVRASSICATGTGARGDGDGAVTAGRPPARWARGFTWNTPARALSEGATGDAASRQIRPRDPTARSGGAAAERVPRAEDDECRGRRVANGERRTGATYVRPGAGCVQKPPGDPRAGGRCLYGGGRGAHAGPRTIGRRRVRRGVVTTPGSGPHASRACGVHFPAPGPRERPHGRARRVPRIPPRRRRAAPRSDRDGSAPSAGRRAPTARGGFTGNTVPSRRTTAVAEAGLTHPDGETRMGSTAEESA